jgi:anti-anti-sigma factor
MEPNWKLHRRDEDGVWLVDFETESSLEEETLEFLDWLAERFTGEKDLMVVVDLSKVSYFSSYAIGRLVRVLKEAWRNDGALKLCGLRPQTASLFAATRLNRLLDIHATAEDALASFSRSEDQLLV